MSTPARLTWVEGWDALAPWFDAWQELSVRTGGEIFLSPQWLRAWWPELGRGRRLLALVAESEGRLVGLLPFMLDRLWLGPLPVTVARFAATDPNCIILDLPVEPPFQAAMLETACRDLLGRFGAGLVSFTPVSDRAAYLPDLTALARRETSLALTQSPRGTHTLFDLPDDFQTFLDTRLSGKRRAQHRRDLSGLSAAFELKNHQSTPDPVEFDAFVAFHNLQWQAQGKGGHFLDWPRSQQIYRALGPLTDGQRGLRFFAQDGNTGPLATQMCFLSGKTAHWRLPARTLDAQANKLSVGKVGLILMIQDLIAAGITRIEGGIGAYDYKIDYGGENIAVNRLIVNRDSTLHRLLLRLCLAWSDTVNFVFYRVWFKRLAPKLRKRLGLPARPLWRLWIGSRI